MTRNILGSLAISALLIAAPLSAASAADMPVKAPPPPPAVFSWTGLYIGGNLGWAWGHSSWCTDATVTTCATAAPLDRISESPSGLVGGAQFGFRWQAPSNFVLGIEGMFDALDMKTLAADPNGPVFAGRTRSTTFDDIASVTGQLGYAWGKTLLYGKGGWAETTLQLDANNLAGFDLNGSQWVQGWTAGGGLEYMILQNVSVGVEYDYYRFNPSNMLGLVNTGGITIGCSFCNFGNTNVQTLTGRLNFKFPG